MNGEFSQLGMRWSFQSNHTTERPVTSPLFPKGKEALIGSITPISLSQPSATLWPVSSDHAPWICQKQTSDILCHCLSMCPGIFGLKIVTMQVQIQIWTQIWDIHISICIDRECTHTYTYVYLRICLYHRLNRHEFQQTLGDCEGQGSLVYCSPWGCKESDTTEQLN